MKTYKKTKKNKRTKKVFIALRWNGIRYEEVHVYCIQSSLSCWRPLFCCAWSEVGGSRLWLGSLVYTPSSIHDTVCLKNIFVTGLHQHDWCLLPEITRPYDISLLKWRQCPQGCPAAWPPSSGSRVDYPSSSAASLVTLPPASVSCAWSFCSGTRLSPEQEPERERVSIYKLI